MGTTQIEAGEISRDRGRPGKPYTLICLYEAVVMVVQYRKSAVKHGVIRQSGKLRRSAAPIHYIAE